MGKAKKVGNQSEQVEMTAEEKAAKEEQFAAFKAAVAEKAAEWKKEGVDTDNVNTLIEAVGNEGDYPALTDKAKWAAACQATGRKSPEKGQRDSKLRGRRDDRGNRAERGEKSPYDKYLGEGVYLLRQAGENNPSMVDELAGKVEFFVQVIDGHLKEKGKELELTDGAKKSAAHKAIARYHRDTFNFVVATGLVETYLAGVEPKPDFLQSDELVDAVKAAIGESLKPVTLADDDHFAMVVNGLVAEVGAEKLPTDGMLKLVAEKAVIPAHKGEWESMRDADINATLAAIKGKTVYTSGGEKGGPTLGDMIKKKK